MSDSPKHEAIVTIAGDNSQAVDQCTNSVMAALRAAGYDVTKLRGSSDRRAERERLEEYLRLPRDLFDVLGQIPLGSLDADVWRPPTTAEFRIFDTSRLRRLPTDPGPYLQFLMDTAPDLVVDQNHSDGALAPLWASRLERKWCRKYPFLRPVIERRKKVVRVLAACITLIAAGTIIRHIHQKGSR